MRVALSRIALSRIAPDMDRISEALSRGRVEQLDGLFVAHSHYDHVLDAPAIIQQLGGRLHGSSSTLNVARGSGLSEASMQLIRHGQEYAFSDFRVCVFEGLHSPGNRYPGTIDAPLVPPTKVSSYRDGGCYSFHIRHPGGTILIHPSANFVPNAFDGLDVDVLYLGIGALGVQSAPFQDDYWHHVVEATHPGLVIPVHWDNFGRPLTAPMRPLPFFMDKFARTKQLLDRKSRESGYQVYFQDPFETIRPFAC